MTDSSSTRNRHKWMPCGCLLGMFLICVFVPVMALVVWSSRSAGHVNARTAKLKQMGLPTESAELDAYYRISPGAEDVTALYIAAQQDFSGSAFESDCRDLPIVGNSELEIPPPGQPWRDLETVQAFLAEYDAGMQALHQAVDKGGAARFPLDFDMGFAMLLPHSQNMRTCSRMLALEAHVKAHQGDAEGAAQALRAMRIMARSLENQPILVSQLVRIAMSGSAVDTTAKLLPHLELPDEELARLQEVFHQGDFRAGIRYALAGERVMGVAAFKNPTETFGPNSGVPRIPMFRGSNEDLAFYLEIHTDLYDGLKAPFPDAFAAVDGTMAKMQNRISTPLGKMRYVLTGMTLPAIDACVSAAARVEGSHRAIDGAIAIERFRRREARLPAGWNELVPELLPRVPLDPFDGKPIRYVIKPDGYLVYTCGRDRVDGGGLDDASMSDDVIRIVLPSAPDPGEDPVIAPPPADAGEEKAATDSTAVPTTPSPSAPGSPPSPPEAGAATP